MKLPKSVDSTLRLGTCYSSFCLFKWAVIDVKIEVDYPIGVVGLDVERPDVFGTPFITVGQNIRHVRPTYIVFIDLNLSDIVNSVRRNLSRPASTTMTTTFIDHKHSCVRKGITVSKGHGSKNLARGTDRVIRSYVKIDPNLTSAWSTNSCYRDYIVQWGMGLNSASCYQEVVSGIRLKCDPGATLLNVNLP